MSKRARTIPLPGHRNHGDGQDYKRWYRCWNCGFRCNIDRDSLGDIDSRAGVTQSDYSPSDPVGINRIPTLDGVEHYQVARELGADGDPKPITYTFGVVVTGGCPLCGTLNWRGDYKI